jgi:hypothetical protein
MTAAMLRDAIKRTLCIALHSVLKADSHIECRAHTAPMPFPCHAVPLRVYNVSFPFDLHSAAVPDSHLPCRAHAIPDHAVLFKATAQHSRRETACGVTASLRFLPAITRSSTKLLSDAYQSQMHAASVKPNTVCHGRGKEW